MNNKKYVAVEEVCKLIADTIENARYLLKGKSNPNGKYMDWDGFAYSQLRLAEKIIKMAVDRE